MLKKAIIIVSLALGFSSLFWWSWAFGHMITGYEVCFKEPMPIIAFIEFVAAGSAAAVLLLCIKKEIKKEKN